MEDENILDQITSFTQLPAIVELQKESETYAELLDEIGKHQPLSSTELFPENKEKFEKRLLQETKLIKRLYIDADILAQQSGFTKEALRSFIRNKKETQLNGCAKLIQQFFAILRNKEKRLNEVQSIIERRDEMGGLRPFIEDMNKKIEKYQ